MESGATAWEVRELARIVRNNGPAHLYREALINDISDILEENNIGDSRAWASDTIDNGDIGNHHTNAILVEALELLAAKKEAERKG